MTSYKIMFSYYFTFYFLACQLLCQSKQFVFR